MRIYITLALPLLLSASGVVAFAPPSQLSNALRSSKSNARHGRLRVSTPSDGSNTNDAPLPEKKQILTAADVVAKLSTNNNNDDDSRGADPNPIRPGEQKQEAPKIFTPQIYDDFQSSLLLLEKRAKDGIGSLTDEEVEQFEDEVDRVLADMKEYMDMVVGDNSNSIRTETMENGSKDVSAGSVVPKALSVAAAAVSAPSYLDGLSRGSGGASDSGLKRVSGKKSFGRWKKEPAVPVPEDLSGDNAAMPLQSSKLHEHEVDENKVEEENVVQIDIDNMSTNSEINANVVQTSVEEKSNNEEEAMMEEDRQISSEEGQQTQQLQSGPSEQAVTTEKKYCSPGKLVQKQVRKSEWQDHLQPGGGDKSNSSVQVMKNESGDRFESTQRPKPASGRKSSFFQVHQDAKPSTSSDEESGSYWDRLTTSATSPDYTCEASKKVSSESSRSFAHGNDGGSSQRPIKSAKEQPRPGYFEVHTSASDERKASPRSSSNHAQSIQVSDHRGPGDTKNNPSASASSSPEAIKSLVGLENRQRPFASTDQPDYIKVKDHRGVGDTRRKNNQAQQQQDQTIISSSASAEKRVRPIPSSDMPEYARVKDHRDVGDTKDHALRRQLHQPSYYGKSLIDTEVRVRPIPSTDRPEYARAMDHRSTGDTKGPKRSLSASVTASLVDTEDTIRPTSSSTLPEYAQVKDHRDAGDTKDPSLRSQKPGPKSLIETEEQIRPVASSLNNRPDRVTVPNHRDPGDSSALTRRTVEPSSSVGAKSLIKTEEQIRPVASSLNNRPDRVTVPNHRDPGDSSALTRRTVEPSSSVSASLIEGELRARPVPSSNQFQNVRVGDHRGPGDTNALTKRLAGPPKSVVSASSSEAEPRVRPSPSSNQFQNFQVGDHRGPGDTNALTRRLESSSSQIPASVTASLSESEQTVRPVALSSNQVQNFQASDHRGVGDTRTLTKKVQTSTIAAAASLSEDEQRQRPVPTAGQSHQSQSFKVTDHRGPGDDRTLTRKVQPPPSLSSYSEVTSLIEGEQRQRPVPSSASHNKFAMVNDRGGSDSRRLTKQKETEPAANSAPPGEEEEWWNEETQRPRSAKFANSSQNDVVLNRGAVDSASAAPEEEPSSSQPTHPSSILKSLLKDEKKQRASHGGNKPSSTKPPLAAFPPSALQSLLKQDVPQGDTNVGSEENASIRRRRGRSNVKSSRPLSTLLREDRQSKSTRLPTYEVGWWNERPKRPRGYVKHFQPMNASYVKKFEPPRDYGNVVTASAETIPGEGDGENVPSSGEEGSDDDEPIAS